MKEKDFSCKRDHWGTKMGLILAMAGNAVGLGNFLRFPSQAAQNGGGAFMIPYFISLIFLAIPLMWAEWAMGRMGGVKGHGTAPGFFTLMWKHPAAKYVGVLGILFPLLVVIYYNYIESWALAYSFFSITGKYFGNVTREGMSGFLQNFQGIHSPWGVSVTAYLFFLLTFAVNIWILSGGISKGIEKLANIAMPVLFLLAGFLVIRVFTLGTPDPSIPENNILNGLGFIWNPDLTMLKDTKVWLAAAGQIFFTTSIGFGAIQCYASYLREKDDVAATGFATVMTNEFAELILGASIAIPIACAFFGKTATVEIAKSGAFNIGFATMPVIFQQIPFGHLAGTLWFALLFIAGITSSVALSQPLITFLKDEMNYSHKKAVAATAVIIFTFSHIAILGLKYGALDELDYWAGTFGIVFFALVEIILFAWVFGADKGWEEIQKGALIRIPPFFKFTLKYITPVFITGLLIAWSVQQGYAVLVMEGAGSEAEIIWKWGARISILLITLFLAYMVSKSERLRDLTRQKREASSCPPKEDK